MSVHKFTDGRKGWYFQFYFEGKKYKKERWNGSHMNTKAEAISGEAEFKKELESKTNNQNIMLYDLYDEFVSVTKANLKESSQHTYKKFKRLYLILIDNVQIKKLSPKIINEWKQKIIDKEGVTVYYKNQIIKIMKSALNYGQLVYNIPGSLQIPLLESVKDNGVINIQTKSQYVPEAEFKRLFANVDLSEKINFYYFTLINILYYTGLRIGELSALTVSDYVNHSFIINKCLIRVEGVDYIQAPKSKSSVRVVLIDERTAELIDRYIDIFKPDDVLFRLNKKYLTQQRVRDVLTKLSKESGLSEKYDIHPHALRHSHASNLRMLGFDEYAISKRLGNTPDVASSTYIHSNDSEQEDIIKKLRKE